MKPAKPPAFQHCWLTRAGGEFISAGRLERRPTRFAVEQDLIVVVDTPEQVVDVSQLAGDPAHAAALIDRALRGQGLMEGACVVVPHATARRPADYDVLFTAYPADWWAGVQSWAAEAEHLVALVPVMALLWASLTKGQALVYRDAARFTFLANVDGRPAMVATQAFSEEASDLASTAALLCESVQAQLLNDGGAGGGAKLVSTLSWFVRLAPAGGDEDADASMAQATAQRLGLDLQPVAHAQVHQGSDAFSTCLPALCERFSARLMTNPPVDRYSLRARQLLPLASTAGVAVALVAMLGAGVAGGLAATEFAQARAVDAQADAVRQASAGRADQERLPETFKATVALVDRIGALLQRPDTTRLTQALRLAGSGGVQVMRLYTVPVKSEGKRPAGDQPARVMVDAIVRNDAPMAVQDALSRFVNTMRRAGFSAVAVDSPGRSAQAVGAALFSYELKSLDAGEGA